MDNYSQPSVSLKEPLDLTELFNGTKFEIATDVDDANASQLFEDIYGSDDEHDTKIGVEESIVSPWTKSFVELRSEMTKMNEHIYKRIVCKGEEKMGLVPEKARVKIRYSAYWEYAEVPFDSTFLRGSCYSFYTARNEVLEGLEIAVRSMYKGESAQFVIGYQKLYLEMGCPPRIKPRSDALFTIDVLSFELVGDLEAISSLAEEDRRQFSLVIDKVREVHIKALDFFKQQSYQNAIKTFINAVDALNYCRMGNKDEEEERMKFLIKLHTNLAVCYIKTNSPKKTLLQCREIRHLTSNNPSCKVLFQEGRAYFLLGEFNRARTLLQEAERIEPSNMVIVRELKVLEKRSKSYKENEKKLWSKAIGFKKEEKNKPKIQNQSKTKIRTRFELEMNEMLLDFKENSSISVMSLPPGLTSNEIDLLSKLVQRMDLTLTSSPIDKDTYTLRKKA